MQRATGSNHDTRKTMRQDVRLHGQISNDIEYFATAASRNAFGGHFYQATAEGLRLFSPGNEVLLDRQGLWHRGNGGSFCEYMFGVDQPLADQAKAEVRNRLVLYGTSYEEGGSLRFFDRTDGFHSYEKIFFEGNAVHNYFFFLTGSVAGSLREQQEGILRLLGKLLKRSETVGRGDDGGVLEEIFSLLGHKSALYLIKLIDRRHQAYHDAFRSLYLRHKAIPDAEFAGLEQLAVNLGIDTYQQERIRVDIMYKHPDNRPIVDEYQNILIACNRKGRINASANARLIRLKTLSVRNKIPSALFYTLDEMFRYDQLVSLVEQDYIAETRQILQGLFFREQQIEDHLDREDLVKLLFAKRRACETRDHTFEQVLLETGKVCDEKIRDGADFSLLESFSSIVTYFDRYDNTAGPVNNLAFMETGPLAEESIRSLLGNKKVFDSLRDQLFDQLFFSGVLHNRYLGQFGRKKILCLQQGLGEIEAGSLTIAGLLERLRKIVEAEALYTLLLSHVKERIRHFYSRYATAEEQAALRREVEGELRSRGLWPGEIPRELFQQVVVNIKKEAIYLHNLLPTIVARGDTALREDFVENSGLDRFYVEELERQYFEHNDLDLDGLNRIRQGLADPHCEFAIGPP